MSTGAEPPPEASEERSVGSAVFDDIKSNATAQRLLKQLMHPNEQVRGYAFEGLVRIVREDDKRRALIEFLVPLLEELSARDEARRDTAGEEIRKLLTR